ncbi:MAG: hypothetical protein MI702_02645 [Chlorobiales bacterium]|nr:hypothetical protein [Chlorobiales bacterium]
MDKKRSLVIAAAGLVVLLLLFLSFYIGRYGVSAKQDTAGGDIRQNLSDEYRQEVDRAIKIVGALVTDNIAGSGFAGRSEFFSSGAQPLYYYVKYRGAFPESTSVAVRWYEGNRAIQEKSIVLQHEAGEILDSCRYNFESGVYEVRLLAEGEQKNSVIFQVVDRALVRIDNSSLVPGVVKPGEVLTATVDYYLQSSADEQRITVREQRIVQRNGRPVMDPIVRDVSRSSGFNSSTARVYLPNNVQPGDYEIITIVSNGTKEAKTSSGFSVFRPAPLPSPSPSPVTAATSYPTSRRSGKNEMTLEQLDAALQKVYRK